MKKQFLAFAICLGLFGLLSTVEAYGQDGGFTGPSGASSKNGKGELVTVAAAKNLPDNAKVTLQGTITHSLGDDDYTFRDNTGEVTVEIDRKVWRGLSVNEKDRVEIYGKVDVERRGIEIEVITIKKL